MHKSNRPYVIVQHHALFVIASSPKGRDDIARSEYPTRLNATQLNWPVQ